MDETVFYAGLLASPCAESRMEGIARWEQHLGLIEELVPLLSDDAPVVRRRGERLHLVEVRAATLVALQDAHRRRGSVWTLGPVRVRTATPVEEADQQAGAFLAGLDATRRREALATGRMRLDERVDPPTADGEACLAYVVLQEAGLVRYELQTVDAETLLTPLQQKLNASQMRSRRPHPHVRFDGPDGHPIGYLYRAERPWVLDLNESPHAARVRVLVGEWRRMGRGGVPRLVLDSDGAAQRHPSGQGLLTSGVVPHDTDDPVSYLHSVAEFVAQQYPARLVR